MIDDDTCALTAGARTSLMMTTMELCDGPLPWLSDLGMEDQTLLRHLDSLPSPTMEPHPMGYQFISNNTDLGASSMPFQAKEAHVGASPTPNHCSTLANGERPLKISRLNSWTFSFGEPAQAQKGFHHEENSNQCLTPQGHFHSQPHLSHAGSFLPSIPKLKDEIHETVAPETPTFHLEMRLPEGSIAQERFITHPYSAAMNMPPSPSELIFGGKSRLLSPGSMRGARKCNPVPARASSSTQDHIMAERKRREKLSQRFIALSAIVPGLKKMDKASVLGDAIKYVKHLQEKLKELEEQVPSKTCVAVSKTKKQPLSSNSSQCAIDVTSVEGNYEDLQPEIEVRMARKNVLIRIHCQKRKGILLKTLGELEKLQLFVINANVLSFSETALDFTCTAQVGETFEMSADDLITSLQHLLKNIK